MAPRPTLVCGIPLKTSFQRDTMPFIQTICVQLSNQLLIQSNSLPPIPRLATFSSKTIELFDLCNGRHRPAPTSLFSSQRKGRTSSLRSYHIISYQKYAPITKRTYVDHKCITEVNQMLKHKENTKNRHILKAWLKWCDWAVSGQDQPQTLPSPPLPSHHVPFLSSPFPSPSFISRPPK